MQDDLSLEVVIAVGCVCGFIVLLLVIILALLCYQRQRAIKKSENVKNRNLSPVGALVRSVDSQSTQKTTTGRDPVVTNGNRPEVANNQVVIFKSQSSGRSHLPQSNSTSAPGDHLGSHSTEGPHAHIDNEKNFEMEKLWRRNFSDNSFRGSANTSDQSRTREDRIPELAPPVGERMSFRSKKVIHEVVV